MARTPRTPRPPRSAPSFPSAASHVEEDDELEAGAAEEAFVEEEEMVEEAAERAPPPRRERDGAFGPPPKPQAIQRPSVANKSGRTVTVACKIPTGLVLQLQRPMNKMEDTREGPVPRTYMVKTGQRYTVKGPAYPVGTPPKGFPKPPINEGGYALTPGIPEPFWREWIEQNRKYDPVVNGMIFAYPDMQDAVAAAAEMENERSGLEPISTDEDERGRLTDPRLPRPVNMSVAKVGPDTDRMNQRNGGG